MLQKGNGGQNGGDAIRVGLPDGRIAPLTGVSAQIRRGLNVYDVVYAISLRAKSARLGVPKREAQKILPRMRPSRWRRPSP